MSLGFELHVIDCRDTWVFVPFHIPEGLGWCVGCAKLGYHAVKAFVVC